MSSTCERFSRMVALVRFVVATVVAVSVLAMPGALAAAPLATPFLLADINGYNAGGGQSIGPTEAGFQGWEMAEGLFLDPSIDWGNSGAPGLTKVFATSQGNVTTNLIGVGTFPRGARNRGANAAAQSALTQDFVFAQRDSAIGLGRNYVKLTLSGLTPNTAYELTPYARDAALASPDSFQAWTDRAALGGLDGPSAWLDVNVGAGASYQPAPNGANNPIPKLARSATTGPDSADPYAYAATFLSTTDVSGILTMYSWADPNAFGATVQSASLLNGFQMGFAVPEPGVALIAALASAVMLARRRRSR